MKFIACTEVKSEVDTYKMIVNVQYGLFRLKSKLVQYERIDSVWYIGGHNTLAVPHDAIELENLFKVWKTLNQAESFMPPSKEPLWTFVGRMESEYYRMQAFFKVEAQSNMNLSKVNTTPSFVSIAFPDTSAGNPFEAGVEYEITIKRKNP